MALVRHQLRRLAAGRTPTPGTRPAVALLTEQLQQRKALRSYRSWLTARRPSAVRQEVEGIARASGMSSASDDA